MGTSEHPNDRFEVDGVAFIGRTFAEYRRMFDLDPTTLAGRRVLDCPGGPGSFTAVASELGAAATAVDVGYGPPPAQLAETCERAVGRTVEQLHEKRDLFVWDEYGDVATRGRYLQAAATRFLADYGTHPSRYVAAGLPQLPFPTDAFDIVLSGNLLFLYDDRLDEAFHRRAARELVRVAADEVRLFSLASLDRERSRFVPVVADVLRDAGLTVAFRSVPYEFQPGATEMLVVSDCGRD